MSFSNPSPPFDSSESEVTDATLADELEARRKLTEGVAYVYVPTQPGETTNGPQAVRFELRRLSDGNAGLPVFTAPELLIAQLGEFQPWKRIAVLDLLIQVSAAHVPVAVNPVVGDDADRWTAADIEAWKRDGR
ncbi:hypothetical protein GCM10023191_011580 [Actinoallomurus oryzae]|jgi:hypothetical protein|uniref:SseB protein N-terminal domain-containing protein n=1 Tax=Actinoallomurus oryzae TaxID=502180 RepID=A0ABP8PGY1_9ACTN